MEVVSINTTDKNKSKIEETLELVSQAIKTGRDTSTDVIVITWKMKDDGEIDSITFSNSGSTTIEIINVLSIVFDKCKQQQLNSFT